MISNNLARFINEAQYEDLSEQAVTQLKMRLLDSLGSAIGAIEGSPVRAIRRMIDDLGGTGTCPLIGGGKSSPGRIEQKDIQSLLQRVNVIPNQEFSDRFPKEMPVKLMVLLKNGEKFQIEKYDYEGFTTHPMSWETAIKKFNELTNHHVDIDLSEHIVEMVKI